MSSAIAKWDAAQSVYSMLSIEGKFYYVERHKYKEFIIKHEKSSFVSTLKSLNAQHWQQKVKQTNLVFKISRKAFSSIKNKCPKLSQSPNLLQQQPHRSQVLGSPYIHRNMDKVKIGCSDCYLKHDFQKSIRSNKTSPQAPK